MDSLNHLLERLFQLRVSESELPKIQQYTKDDFGPAKESDMVKRSLMKYEPFVKFWLLNDGTLIFVPRGHIMFDYTGLIESGAIRVSSDPGKELSLDFSKTPTADQIRTLQSLASLHGNTSVVIENPKTISSELAGRGEVIALSSPRELSSILRGQVSNKSLAAQFHERRGENPYNWMLNEGVKLQVSPSKLDKLQREIKNRIKPSTDIKVSTSYFKTEQAYRRFLILNDGSVIPVKQWHTATILGVEPNDLLAAMEQSGDYDPDLAAYIEDDPYAFDESGGVQGRVDDQNHEITINSLYRLNPKQIASVVNLVIKYKVTELIWGFDVYVEEEENEDDTFISVHIKSIPWLKMVLAEGPEFAEEPVNESVVNESKTNEAEVGPFDFGFITPSGKDNSLSDTRHHHHVEYAFDWLGRNGYGVSDGNLIARYCRATGDVRYSVSGDRISIDVYTPITRTQLMKIRKMIPDPNSFYFDIHSQDGLKAGDGFNSFLSELRELKMIK